MLEQMGEGNIRLVFKDNGVGARDPHVMDRGSGLRLIRTISRSSARESRWDMASGTAVTLIFSSAQVE